MNRRFLLALLGASMLGTACFDLDLPVIQPTGGTTFTREEIIANPALMERLVAGTFVIMSGGIRDNSPWTYFGVYGEEITTSVTDVGGEMFSIISEPRGEVPNFLGVDHTVMRDPWHLFYEANSSAAEYGGMVRREGIRIIDPVTRVDNTTRFLSWSRFIQGMAHVYLGLIFDSAAVVHEGVDLSKPLPLPLAHHYEVLDSGMKWLQEAADIADTASFAFPLNEGQWIFRTGFDNTQLSGVAHAYIARALAYGARTAAERSGTCTEADCRNVDWQLVKTHLQKSTKSNFGPRGRSASGFGYGYRAVVSSPPTNNVCGNDCDFEGVMRVDNRLVGPADTTGSYMAWLDKVAGAQFDTVAPFTVSTYDQRIQAVGNTLPNVKPTFFKVTDVLGREQEWETGQRGPYYQSFYWSSSRTQNNHTQIPNTGGGRNEPQFIDLVQDEMMLVAELNLLMAEANIRLGGAANLAEAAELINRTREPLGELPGVTAAGVPASVPGAPCIPKVYDGSALGACGNLFEAMMYEKRIETYGTAIAYFDLRGWGCLAQGTPQQLAPPANQMDLLGKRIYTFGGFDGATAGAPKPTNCRLLWKP